MRLTLPISEVLPATPRSRILRVGLGTASFPYLPGQAVLIAAHGNERRRPYSLASAPEEAASQHVLELLVGLNSDGTAGPHLSLEPGSLVDVEGPLGRFTFPDTPDAEHFVFVAGGTGIAPLRSMLHRAMRVPHRSISVVYSARTFDDFAYGEELNGLAAAGKIQFRQTVTREPGEAWTGARGRIGQADLAPLVTDPATLCFICGPPALVHDVPRMLADVGVEPQRIRIEEWS